jgi:nicotinamidase-related amidase
MDRASSLLDMLGAPAKPATLANSAVVIVDAQREYLDGSIPLKGIDNALAELKTLLARARALSIPIFHVVHHTEPGAPIFDPTGPMSEIIDAVKPEGDEPVIKKNLPSAFVNTDLQNYLTKTGRKEVVIGGFMTHMCINATTRSAVDLGFTPTVIASACATRDLPATDGSIISAETVHRTNLASLADLLACVCNSTEDLR